MSRSFSISVRRRYYRWRALRTTKEVNRLIASGYNPRKDPESPYYEGAVRSKNPKPSGIDYGDTKYALVETANYLRGRKRMVKRGAKLNDLDYAIGILLHGDPLPSRFNPHPLYGEFDGQMECHIKGYGKNDWVLRYEYDHKELVLFALCTGTHDECGVGHREQRSGAVLRMRWE